MVRIKICGITNIEDALVAVEAGADALGFVFHPPSPRCVTPDVVRAISHALPPFVTRVGVFVDSPLGRVTESLDYCRLDLAQLHGVEDEAYCEALYPRAVKALRIGRDDVASALAGFHASSFLLDTFHPKVVGGTGATFDWDIARSAVATGKTIVLSGGLNPANVSAAIAAVKPYAVDVASGVEAAPGTKDHAKVRAFVAAVRVAERALSETNERQTQP